MHISVPVARRTSSSASPVCVCVYTHQGDTSWLLETPEGSGTPHTAATRMAMVTTLSYGAISRRATPSEKSPSQRSLRCGRVAHSDSLKVRSTPIREDASGRFQKTQRADVGRRQCLSALIRRYKGTGLWRPSVHSDVAF